MDRERAILAGLWAAFAVLAGTVVGLYVIGDDATSLDTIEEVRLAQALCAVSGVLLAVAAALLATFLGDRGAPKPIAVGALRGICVGVLLAIFPVCVMIELIAAFGSAGN